jgi:hypothetical protein
MMYSLWEYTITYYGASVGGLDPRSIANADAVILDVPQHVEVSNWAIGTLPLFLVPITWIVQCA